MRYQNIHMTLRDSSYIHDNSHRVCMNFNKILHSIYDYGLSASIFMDRGAVKGLYVSDFIINPVMHTWDITEIDARSSFNRKRYAKWPLQVISDMDVTRGITSFYAYAPVSEYRCNDMDPSYSKYTKKWPLRVLTYWMPDPILHRAYYSTILTLFNIEGLKELNIMIFGGSLVDCSFVPTIRSMNLSKLFILGATINVEDLDAINACGVRDLTISGFTNMRREPSDRCAISSSEYTSDDFSDVCSKSNVEILTVESPYMLEGIMYMPKLHTLNIYGDDLDPYLNIIKNTRITYLGVTADIHQDPRPYFPITLKKFGDIKRI